MIPRDAHGLDSKDVIVIKKIALVAAVGCISPLLVAADMDELIEGGGDVLAVTLPLTALTASFTLDDPEGRKQLLYSYGTTFVVTHATKFAVGKERPDGSNNRSFPSGHTSGAFSGAAFLAKRYGWDIGVPAYLAASYVGYSRVHANKHDWWDVAAGAALAIGVNEWLVSGRDDISVAALPSSQGWQVAMSVRF